MSAPVLPYPALHWTGACALLQLATAVMLPLYLTAACRQYRFPVDTGTPKEGTPLWSPHGTTTARWPDMHGGTDLTALNSSVLLLRWGAAAHAAACTGRAYSPAAGCTPSVDAEPTCQPAPMPCSNSSWRQGMQQVLAETDWYCFSNHDAPLRVRHCLPASATAVPSLACSNDQ